ncbi:glycosyltransferase family 2 protein [bacterium]|nr:glycosyltransferase family 2 protein [bacterium]
MMTFVILHYNNIDETMECLDSLEKFNSNIVVVSNSKDYDNLKMIEKRVSKVIINEENIGFAKANNIGCKYAIEYFQPDFLCVINNDVIIEQKDFITQVEKLYKKYKFDILGPKILPEESDSCNPFYAYKTLDEVRARIKYTEKLIKIYQNKFLRLLLNIYLKVKAPFRKEKKTTNGSSDQLNVALHGCALIFSKKYYKKYNDVFYNGTFLFHEEEFLALRAKENNLVMLYSPKIELYHKEGSSLAKKFQKQKYDSLIFRNKEILKSLKLLEKEMLKQEAKD